MRLTWGGAAAVFCIVNAAVNVAACVGDASSPSGPDSPDGGPIATTPDAAGTPVDGSLPDADAVDAGPDAPSTTCDPSAPFTSSALVENINSAAGEFAPSLTPDETTIFFQAYRTGAGVTSTVASIFTSTRASATDEFALATPVAELNTDGDNGGPWIMPDNKTLYLDSSRSGNYDLFVAVRQTPTSVFGPLSAVANVNTSFYEYTPSLSPDATEMFFGSARTGAVRTYRAAASGGAFGTPTEVTELTTASGGSGGIASPALSASGLVLYFAVSQSSDYSGVHQVWVAGRPTKNDAFTNIHAVTEVNTDGPAQGGWISPDLCRLYVAQTRTIGGVGGSDIFVYSRTP